MGGAHKKYPRLGTSWRNDKGNKICRIPGCGDKARTQQFVEFSWFRGDDEGVWICAKRNHSTEEVIAAIEEQLRCRKKS